MGVVKINPEILKWAREDAGYTFENLPNNFRKNFQYWENGERNPTWNQLCEISTQLKRPTAFFFRKNPPERKNIDFIEYIKSSSESLTRSPQLNIALRQFIHKRQEYMVLLEEMNYPKISFHQFTKNSANVQDISLHIRSILGVNIETQKEWIYTDKYRRDNKHYNFLNKWKEQINKLGVLVFEVSRVSLDEMRALCVYYDEYPIILLNGSDSVNGRIFSLLHELSHLILKHKAICDITHDNSKEFLCNSVAAEVLVPENEFLKENIVVNNKNNTWTNHELNELSHKYGVSKETILLRLLNLHKTTLNFYDSKKIELNNRVINKNKKGGGSPVKNQIKYNGKMYMKLFLTAYENDIITGSEFSEAVDLKLNDIDELIEELI